MNIRFENYNGKYKIVSLALSENAREEFVSENLSHIFVDESENKVILFPEQEVLSSDGCILEELKKYNNYDVFELWNNGVLTRKYDDHSGDNYFFITGKCNSNCIMCPSPEQARRTSNNASLTDLIDLARHIPSDVPHLTITGGEPFLMGDNIFPFLQFLKERFEETEFLLLTNGRIFAVNEFVEAFCLSAPEHIIVAIPVHGSCEQVHDSITRTTGSFKQTIKGIKNLLKEGIPVEIRLVVSKLNINDFEKIAQLIIQELNGIEYVSVIAMEMTGTAKLNQDQVWIPYKQAFLKIENAIRCLIQNGIDVKLYNFPLCTVKKSFWTLCEKSISANKIRFADECELCKYKNACSGVFAGTIKLERDELKAIL